MGNLPENLFLAKSRNIALVKFCAKDGNSPEKLLLLKAINSISSITPRHGGNSPSKKLLDKSSTANHNLQKDSGIWPVIWLENRDSSIRFEFSISAGRGPDKALSDKSKMSRFGSRVGS